MNLTKDMIQELRKPFKVDQLKWKIQTQPKDPKTGPKKLEGWGVVVSYLDARDVAERLDVVVGGEWHDEYTLFGAALECSLTVCGVTRKDVGEASTPKELYSDAFKRAAVKFGVGAFLYRMPTIMAQMTRKDEWKPYQFTDAAKASLRQIAEAVASGQAPAARYPGLMLLSEYQAPDAGDDGHAASQGPQNRQQPAPRQNTRPAPAQGQQQANQTPQGTNLSSEKAQALHKQLGVMLSETQYREMSHNAFAAQVIGRDVKSLTDLTTTEAKEVHSAAQVAQQEATAA